MFERYTEKARRAIFFARYAASHHGIAEIDTRCLLLGILRADKDLMSRLLPSGSEEIARLSADVDALFPESTQEIPTGVDMPLSDTAKYALAYAAEESARLGHKSIDGAHLLVGLLRTNGPEVACLKAHGIDLERVRREFVQGVAISQPKTEQASDWTRAQMELFWALQAMPADRQEAAATLLGGLASGKFEATGTSRNGPFHFKFDDKTE